MKKQIRLAGTWMWGQYVDCINCRKTIDLSRHSRALKVREKPGEFVMECCYCKKKMIITEKRKKFLGILPYCCLKFSRGR